MHYKNGPSSLSTGGVRLYPKFKNALTEQRFPGIPDIYRSVTTLMRGIPEDDFEALFRQWRCRLTKLTDSRL
jgi:hypothetical protein